MTKEQYLKYHQDMCQKMIEITVKKNADYTGVGDDPFHNFRSCELLNVASALQGLQIRMLDKMARLNSFAQKGFLEVKDESVFDTLLDLANYAILTSAFIKSEIDDQLPVWGSPEVIIKAGEKL